MTTDQKAIRSAAGGRLSEAEGLIDLITIPARKLGLAVRLRRRVARRALHAAFKSNPPEELSWRRDLAVGQALRLLGRYQQAVGPLLSAVRRQPAQRSGWVALGWCLKRSGQVDRAASVLAQAISAVPDDAVLHFNFACYLALLGQAEPAISELLWALDLDPELRRRLASEHDFDPIRANPAFQAICHASPW